MLKKYNVTVQRSLINNVNEKQMLCNKTDTNSMFKCNVLLIIVAIAVL
jgi:hypothetical protein